MHRVIAGLAAACWACGGGAAGNRAPAAGKAPELDVEGEWIDPEALQAKPARPAPRPAAAPPAAVVIRHATILTAAGERIDDGAIVLSGGKIAALGAADLAAPAGAQELDGRGRFVSPGIIDAHSHMGVYPSLAGEAQNDGNEMTDPNTAGVAAEYAYLPDDPAITRALAGGVTTALILPGSGNAIGGRGLTVALRPGRRLDEVRFPGAPPTLKMACGENPKRVYGAKGGPQTRMGLYAAFRNWFQAAADYNVKLELYARRRGEWEKRRARAAELDAQAKGKRKVKPEGAPEPPPRDARLETLAAALRGEVLVQVHCYTARDMTQMLAAADAFGLRIRAFHHALDAYKVRDELVARGVAIATWADQWGFKMEALDGIPENAALFAEAGGRPAIHSDSSIGIQRLNQEAAKALAAGRAAGIDLSDDEALRWVTANPAWILGIDQVTGTLEPGKRADVVLWSASPLSVYARADKVFVAGELVFDRARGLRPSDFELGNSPLEVK